MALIVRGKAWVLSHLFVHSLIHLFIHSVLIVLGDALVPDYVHPKPTFP